MKLRTRTKWPLVAIAAGICWTVALGQRPGQDAQQGQRQERRNAGPRRPSNEEFLKSLPAGVKAELDIAYREGNPAWKLDLIMPEHPGDKPRPAIVFVHGGGWRNGDKRGGAQTAVRYARRGYVCISANYRMTGEAPFPACVHDVKNAVRWFRANAKKYNVDPNRIGGSGHSAGAHLVSMLGVVGADAGLEGAGPYQNQSSLLNAVSGMATPADFSDWHRPIARQASLVALLAGPEESLQERAKKASPTAYAHAGAPPFLLIHGTADNTVDVSQAEGFAAALKKAGAKDVNLLILEDAGHTPSREYPNEVRWAVESFFDRTIGGWDVKPAAAAAPAAGNEPQAATPRQDAPSRQPRQSRTLVDRVRANDKNGDGKITKDEASEVLLRFFDNWDANGDGVIDEAELQARSEGSPGNRQPSRPSGPAAGTSARPPGAARNVPAGVEWIPNIAYREGNEAWRLDLSMPKEAGDAPRPGLVFIHGGGWKAGDKRANYWGRLPMEYARRGFVAISINYRLSEEAPFPACVEDVKCAVRWFRAHAEQYNVDPKRIGAFGHSAGAHLAAMLGLTDRQAGLEGDGPYPDQSSVVQAVGAGGTPADFLNWWRPLDKHDSLNLLLVKGGPASQLNDRAKRASPVAYAHKDAPPFLLIHGADDRLVRPDQPRRLAEALIKAGAEDVAVEIVDGVGHNFFNEKPETFQLVEKFFDRTLGMTRTE